MSHKLSLKNIIKLCIILGILTHPIWSWSFKATFIPKPSDFFFALAIAGSIVYFLGEGRRKLNQVPHLIYIALFLFGISIVLGTAMGYLRYGIPPGGWHHAVLHLFRIGGGLILLLFIWAQLREDYKLGKGLYVSFCASSLFFFIPFLISPLFPQTFASLGRFMGFAGNTGMFAVLAFPAFVFILGLFLRAVLDNSVKSQYKVLLFGLWWTVVTLLVLLSAARSYFGAMILAVVVLAPALGIFYKASIRKILAVTIANLLVIGFLFVLSPTFSKFQGFSISLSEVQKLGRQIENYIELQLEKENITTQIEQPLVDGRFVGFRYYYLLFKKDPLIPLLGLGINYPEKFDLRVGDLSVGKNILFEVFLVGGIGAVIALIILAVMVLRGIFVLFYTNVHEQLTNRKRKDLEPLYVLAPTITLLGWWTAAIFLGTPFTLIVNWILLGMALANSKFKNQNSK